MTSETVQHISIEEIGGELAFEHMSDYPQVWEQIPEVLSATTLQSERGPVDFSIDWSGISDYIAYFMVDESLSDTEDVIEVPCAVRTAAGDEVLHYHYVEYLLHQIFLALNLSLPGCCDFRRTVVRSENRAVERPLGLSSGIFGIAYDQSSKRNWPPM